MLRRPGPLTSEFASAADEAMAEPRLRSRAALRRLRRIGTADRFEQAVARRVLQRVRPALVYLNTVKSACYVRPALELGLPVVLHIHEPGGVAASTLTRYRLGPLLAQVGVVACSPPVRDELAATFDLPVGGVAYLPSPVDAEKVEALAAGPNLPGPRDAEPIVGTCGTADHRKGVDLWLRMVAEMRREPTTPRPRFVWVGRVRDREARRLARRLRIDDVVDFVGEVANPYPLVAGMSVFTLSSREDPFPVAVLEAMALARPVVAFAVGGVPEQIGDAGVLVPPADVDAMAASVRTLLEDEDTRRQLGARARARIRSAFDADGFRGAVRDLVDARLRAATDQASDGK